MNGLPSPRLDVLAALQAEMKLAAAAYQAPGQAWPDRLENLGAYLRACRLLQLELEVRLAAVRARDASATPTLAVHQES